MKCMEDGPGIADMIRNLRSLKLNVPSFTWSLAKMSTPAVETFNAAAQTAREFVCVLILLSFSGDEILQVNGETLQGLTHQEAIQTFKVHWWPQNQPGGLLGAVVDCSAVFVQINTRQWTRWIHRSQGGVAATVATWQGPNTARVNTSLLRVHHCFSLFRLVLNRNWRKAWWLWRSGHVCVPAPPWLSPVRPLAPVHPPPTAVGLHSSQESQEGRRRAPVEEPLPTTASWWRERFVKVSRWKLTGFHYPWGYAGWGTE